MTRDRLRPWRRTHLGTEADRATFRDAPHRVASPPPRCGRASRRRAPSAALATCAPCSVRRRRRSPTPAACSHWDGIGSHHRGQVPALLEPVVDHGRTRIVSRGDLPCDDPGCPVRQLVVSPLVVEETLVGTLVVGAPQATGGLVRAADEVAVVGLRASSSSPQLDVSRTRLMEAEVRALRAQISPHFVYNSLGAIASFVRTDPDRARELLLEFADFTRYSFRRHGEYTTLAEELRSIERYLLLEQARFGDRLQVTLRIAPGGAAGRRAVPLHPAAGRERRPPRAGGQRRQGGRRRPAHDRGPRRRPGVRDRGRGRRRRRGSRAGTPGAGR